MNAPSPSLPAPRGSSFYVAMRVLPQHKRQAMFDIYGFCRAVDDIADDCARAREPRHSELQAWRDHVDAVFAGHPPPALEGLARTIRAYDLQRVDFLAIIDGMDMDVAADIRAPDWATLDLYCDRVASAVGRLSTRIFGLDARDGEPLAEQFLDLRDLPVEQGWHSINVFRQDFGRFVHGIQACFEDVAEG